MVYSTITRSTNIITKSNYNSIDISRYEQNIDIYISTHIYVNNLSIITTIKNIYSIGNYYN